MKKNLLRWLANRTSCSRPRSRVRPSFDVLEDRLMPSTFTVTNLADSGAGSLRDALTQANAQSGPSTINFGVTGAITLESALPDLSQNISILGPGPASLTVQRDASAPAFGIFTIDPGETVTIAGLTISGGLAPDPVHSGGITAKADTLTVNNCMIANNNGFAGAGIQDNTQSTGGALTVLNSTFSNNSSPQPNVAGYYGGGIYCLQLDALTIAGSTFSSNISAEGAAVWYGGVTTTKITGCTFSGNTAS